MRTGYENDGQRCEGWEWDAAVREWVRLRDLTGIDEEQCPKWCPDCGTRLNADGTTTRMVPAEEGER